VEKADIARIVKSFHLFIVRPPVVSPNRVATDYTPEDAAAFREQFKPLARHYRQRSRMTVFGVAGAFVCAVLGVVWLPHFGTYFFFGGACSCLLILLTTPVAPDCPACHNKLDAGFGMFCPECGSQTLRPGGWFGIPRCESCGKTMHGGRGRGYKIRACTFCGLMLDHKGF
jgi:hypothetical protein